MMDTVLFVALGFPWLLGAGVLTIGLLKLGKRFGRG